MPIEEDYRLNYQDNLPTVSVDLDKVRAYIREKMAESHVTTADLARKTGVAKGTLDNFFDGTTKSPTFDKICLIIMALEASLDEAVGLSSSQPVHHSRGIDGALIAEIKEAHRNTLAAKDEHINHLNKELAAEQARSRRLTLFLRLFVAENILLVFIFLLDWFNPDWGYFRYRISQMHILGNLKG